MDTAPNWQAVGLRQHTEPNLSLTGCHSAYKGVQQQLGENGKFCWAQWCQTHLHRGTANHLWLGWPFRHNMGINTEKFIKDVPCCQLQHPHLGHIFMLVPFGDGKELCQSLWVLVTDIISHLPHQIFLMLIELSVAPPLQYFLQLQFLLMGITAKSIQRAQPQPKGLAQPREMQ